MMTNRRLTGLVATVLFAVAACSEPTSPSAPRILANVASPAGHYHVEFRSWIPQYWVVDPSVAGLPVSYAQSLLIPNFSNCLNPGWLAPITTVYSRWVGDNHVPYDGSYRTSTTVDFDWDGTNIANYTTNFYVGTSHRDLLYVWPGGLWWSGGWTECTVAHPGKLNCWVVSCNTSSVTIPVAPPPAPSGNTIYPGQALIQNTSQSTLWSSDGRFFVVMQGDGNFCLYWNGVRVLWCAPGTYHHGYEAIMQGDGNFAIYDAGGAYVWGTYNGNIRAVQPGSYITMQNDGNFVEYGSTGASWASNTCCH